MFVNDVGVDVLLEVVEGVSAVFPVSNAAFVNKVQSQFLRVLVEQQQQQLRRRTRVSE